jgi:hypothetical protein
MAFTDVRSGNHPLTLTGTGEGGVKLRDCGLPFLLPKILESSSRWVSRDVAGRGTAAPLARRVPAREVCGRETLDGGRPPGPMVEENAPFVVRDAVEADRVKVEDA